jgi:hypothetical protein
MNISTLTPRLNPLNRMSGIRTGGPISLLPIPSVVIFGLLEGLADSLLKHAHDREQTKRYIAAATLEAEKIRQDGESLRDFMGKAFLERREIIALVATGLRSEKIEIYERACQLIVEILRINPLLQYAELLRERRAGVEALHLEGQA